MSVYFEEFILDGEEIVEDELWVSGVVQVETHDKEVVDINIGEVEWSNADAIEFKDIAEDEQELLIRFVCTQLKISPEGLI